MGLRDVGTTILWHVYMMIGPALEKWVDILPEHYRHIWQIGNSICLERESITDMPYLEACIKEALRIFSPVSRNDRMCTKDWQDEGLFIPKGMLINIPLYVIHHNPEYWPEPELFKPERFLKENADKIVPYSWLPFGAGPRACIGERFAMAEMKMALAKVFSKFRVEADENLTRIEFQKGDQAMMSYTDIHVRMSRR